MTYDGSIRINTQLNTKEFERSAEHLKGSMIKLGGSIKGLMGSLGLAIGIVGLVKLGKQAVETASDIQEVQNVVDTAFGDMSYKMEQFASTAVKQFGMSKLSAKEMGSTFMAMGASMVGSMEDASNMAIALTGRAADMASFYNKSAQETATALKSIYTGETETLKEYGVVMTEVNLQEYAAEKGIHKKISAMTQAEKVQLRYNYVMEQTSLAAGDFEKTSGSWANQTRILSEQFKELLSVLGSGLITALTPVVQFLNTVLTQLIAIATQIGAVMSRLLGISMPTADAKKFSADMSAAAGGAGELADGIEEAGKEAKKALAPFDDLNVLADKSGGGKGGAGAGASGGGFEIPKLEMKDEAVESQSKLADKFTYFLGKLKDAAKDALDALSKLWDEGLSMLGNFAWDTLRDFYNHFLAPVGEWVLGEGLARFFNITNNLLKSIDWNTLLRALRDFYGVLAKFAKFTFKAVLDFYEYFLSPVSTWVMNKALVLLLDTLTDLGNKINWNLLNGALAKMWEALAKFTIGIGDGLILFWKAIEPTVASAAAGMVDALALSLQFLSDAILAIPESVLVALGGAIGGLLSTFATYSAVSYAMDSISTAWTALYVAFDDGLKILMAHPYLALAAGIGAVVGALLSLQERAKERSEIAAYGDTVDALTRQFKSNREEIERRVEAAKDYVDNAGAAEIRHAEDLKTKYFQLAEKQNKSNAEYDLMRGYASQLVEIFPELNGYIDNETGLLSAQEGMLQNLIDKQKEYYRVQAAKDKIIELYQQQFNMEEQLAEQTEKVKAANEELNKALEDEARINADYWDNMGIKRGEESIALQNARQNVIDLNAELQKSIDTYNNIGQSIDRMSQIAAEGTAKMNTAGQESGEGYVGGIADAINKKHHSLYEPVQGVADKVNAKFKTAGNDGADGYAKGFEEKTSVIENAAKTSIEAGIAAAKTAQDSHSPSEIYKSLGKDAVDGYNLGITENTASSVTAVTDWAAQILAAMKTALGIGEDAAGDVTASMFGGILTNFEAAWLAFSEKWAECHY